MCRMLGLVGVGSRVGVTTDGSSGTTVFVSSVCVVSVERRWVVVSWSGGSGSGVGSAGGPVLCSGVRSGWGVDSVVVARLGSSCSRGSVVVAVGEAGVGVVSSVNKVVGAGVTPMADSSLVCAGVVDAGSLCATGGSPGSFIGMSDNLPFGLVLVEVAGDF